MINALIRSLVLSQMKALSQCVSVLTLWFLDDDGLQLNSSKSEAMILGSRQDLFRLGALASLVIGDGHVGRNDIKVRGIHLDPTLSMNAHCSNEGVDQDIRL